jgi:hypothetical protein
MFLEINTSTLRCQKQFKTGGSDWEGIGVALTNHITANYTYRTLFYLQFSVGGNINGKQRRIERVS